MRWCVQAALERQLTGKLPADAVLQPEMPASCLPVFSDVYSKRFVCLTKPPAGMTTLPVRAKLYTDNHLDSAPRSTCRGLVTQRSRQEVTLFLLSTPCVMSLHTWSIGVQAAAQAEVRQRMKLTEEQEAAASSGGQGSASGAAGPTAAAARQLYFLTSVALRHPHPLACCQSQK